MRRTILLLLSLFLLPIAASAAELKLASWNIAWLTLRSAELPRDQPPRAAADLERLKRYAQRLDADILALQEVDGPEAAALVLDPGAYAFFFPDEADLQRTGFAVRRGLRVRQNPDLAGLDLRPRARFSLRRGTDITVETAAGPLRLLSIHLIAGCREAPLGAGEACESLDRQAEILAGWVAARQAEGTAFAILGDFNRAMAGPEDALLRRLTAAGPLTRVTEGVSDPCWTGGRGGRRFIDQILLGGPARRWLVPGSLRVMVYEERDPRFRDRLSDHCPLSVRLGARAP
ncbi:endonuclease/exonuclease/phosphatase family protein [Siccirubricoccus sp. KC 17139]|uniref:Endonuclease/exonuclease/phosphatase family protein n=1 Tax=Siccirubricoccus soli TaxID=2899147 RepID=A0ABT1DBP4_9PROT|nr:endonuclease/exonuclease/phosphatase family protein [Siccirubricoccus soli]MCO6418630.1 endonuclease/exonuclease/phosphatase family protein [Siccirubricoccus soli]MCP2684765.1 endonuclease/exonuclease/phosphatase family protein [Siccirubricoccus soli]